MRHPKGLKCGAWGLALLFTATIIAMNDHQSSHAQESNAQLMEATDFFEKLAHQSGNPVIANMARESLAKLQQKPIATRQVVVPLMEQPDTSLVVPVIIQDRIMATFMVDTGASYTVITPRMARKLGVTVTRETPRISIITANGAIKAPMVKLTDVAIGDVRIPEVTAIIQELGNGDDTLLSGLLGMNFFQGMDLTVKQDSLILGIRNTSVH